jgi:hypothetical protein
MLSGSRIQIAAQRIASHKDNVFQAEITVEIGAALAGRGFSLKVEPATAPKVSDRKAA